MSLPMLPGYGFERYVSSEGTLAGVWVLDVATSLSPTADLPPLFPLL